MRAFFSWSLWRPSHFRYGRFSGEYVVYAIRCDTSKLHYPSQLNMFCYASSLFTRVRCTLKAPSFFATCAGFGSFSSIGGSLREPTVLRRHRFSGHAVLRACVPQNARIRSEVSYQISQIVHDFSRNASFRMLHHFQNGNILRKLTVVMFCD